MRSSFLRVSKNAFAFASGAGAAFLFGAHQFSSAYATENDGETKEGPSPWNRHPFSVSVNFDDPEALERESSGYDTDLAAKLRSRKPVHYRHSKLPKKDGNVTFDPDRLDEEAIISGESSIMPSSENGSDASKDRDRQASREAMHDLRSFFGGDVLDRLEGDFWRQVWAMTFTSIDDSLFDLNSLEVPRRSVLWQNVPSMWAREVRKPEEYIRLQMNCPCLSSMVGSPCAEVFRESFGCYLRIKFRQMKGDRADVDTGMELCKEKFAAMDKCVKDNIEYFDNQDNE